MAEGGRGGDAHVLPVEASSSKRIASVVVPVAIAAIYEEWTRADENLLTFVMITTPPNPLISHITHQMPAILPIGKVEQWLRAEPTFKCSMTPEAGKCRVSAKRVRRAAKANCFNETPAHARAVSALRAQGECASMRCSPASRRDRRRPRSCARPWRTWLKARTNSGMPTCASLAEACL